MPSSGPAVPPVRAPGLSVVVPVHDGERTVGRAVDSLLAQAGVDLEVVVVDDGSTDASASVAAKTGDPRVRMLRRHRAGVAAARNAGVAAARHAIVAFLDADDEVLPGWAVALTGALADPRAGLASCGIRRAGADGAGTEVLPRPLGPAFGGITASYLAGTFAVRRSLFDHAGGYRTDLRFGEGFELGLRLARSLAEAGLTAVAIDAPLAVWHVDAPRRHHPEALLASAELVLREHADAFALDPRLRSDHHAVAGVNAARLGDLRAARRHLLAAVRHQPSPRTAGRFVAATVPALARRVWPAPATPPPRHRAPGATRPLGTAPTATVVIACYDGGEHLVEQVRALAPQLRPGRSELLLADNGSTDGSAAAAASAGGPLVRVVPASGRRGQCHARNTGAAAGTGEVLLFLDQDDRVQPGYLDAMLGALRVHPLVAARLAVDALNDPVTRASRSLAQASGLGEGLHPWAYACTLGIDRVLFEAVDGFDEDLSTAEDVDLCYRLQERYEVELHWVPDAVVDYRFRPGRRATFAQGRKYGAGAADIYLRHRRHGLRPDPPARVIRQWVGLARWLVSTDPCRRRQAQFLTGARLGRLEGSLRRGVWFP